MSEGTIRKSGAARSKVLGLGLLSIFLVASLAGVTPASAQGGITVVPTAIWHDDSDENGFLDTVYLSFNSNILDSSIRPGDFVIRVGFESIVPHGMSTTVRYNALPSASNEVCGENNDGTPAADTGIAKGDTEPSGLSANDNCFALFYQENALLRTGARPWVKYDAGTTDAPAGTLSSPIQGVASFFWKDKAISEIAGPIMHGLFGKVNDDYVTVTFSEQLSSIDAAGLCYVDGDGNDHVISQATAMNPPGSYKLMLATHTLVASDFDTTPGKLETNDCAAAGTSGKPTDNGGWTARNVATQSRTIAWSDSKYVTGQQVSAQVGSDRIHVKFTTGVIDNAGQALEANDFSVVAQATSGQGYGIRAVQHQPGSPWATLLLNDPLDSKDLETGTNTNIRVRTNDQSVYPVGGPSSPIPEPQPADPKYPPIDDMPPRISSLHTVDANGDGYLDAVRVIFTDRMDDSSARLGDNTVPVDRWRVFLRDGTEVQVTEMITGGVGIDNCKTTLGPNVDDDNNWFLCFDQGTVDENGACTVATASVEACIKSNARLSVTYDPNVASTGRVFEDLTGNDLLPHTGQVSQDNAAPRIIEACTQDTAGKAGHIDSYLVTFSEPVDATTVVADAWKVGGYTIDSVTPITGFSTTLAIALKENDKPDTGVVPHITYDSAKGAVKDAWGNTLPSVSGDDGVKERDCARPVIYHIQGKEGENKLTVTFSENVRNVALKTALRPNEFVYQNSNQAGATGIKAVTHTKDTFTAVLELHQNLIAQDLLVDRIRAADNGIEQSTEGKNPLVNWQNSADRHAINESATPATPTTVTPSSGTGTPNPNPQPQPQGDTSNPTQPGSLTVDSSSSQSLTFKFTAAADNVGVTGYIAKIQAGTFSSFTGTTNELPSGATATYTGPDSSNKMTLRVSGLDPDTTYSVAVRARDGAGNLGLASNVAQAATTTDNTPPTTPIPSLSVSELKTGDLFQIQWTVSTDAESPVTGYRWVIDSRPSTAITSSSGTLETDTRISVEAADPGAYFFHVAAISSGGVSSTAHLRFDVLPDVSDSDMAAFNQRLQDTVRVTTDGDKTVLRWTLPSNPPAELVGLQIWCGEGNSFTLNSAQQAAPGDRQVTVQNPCTGGEYVMTGYYAGDVGLGDSSSPSTTISGFNSLNPAVAEDTSGIPSWVWVVVAIGLLIVIAIVILLLVTRKKPAPEEGTWEESNQDDDGWNTNDANVSWEESNDETWEPEATDDKWDDVPPAAGADVETPWQDLDDN